MKKLLSIRTIILFFLALTACDFASGQQTITGTTSDGGLYELAVPGGWNGTLVERYPKQYDGALSMCGVVGGSTDEVQYLANARILFDYFFPGVMPGDAFHSPTLDFSPGSPAFNAVLQATVIGFSDPRQPTI